MQPLATLPARGCLRVLRLGLELHAEPPGERLQRAREVQPFGLHDEAEWIPRCLTAEAVVELLIGADVKRGRPLVVKRAQTEVAVGPGATELGPGRDESHHVDGIAHPVARIGCVASHGANATGMLSSSNVRMQKRSVIPAR